MVTHNTLQCALAKEIIYLIKIAVDLNECLKQTKLLFSLYTCAPIIKLPSRVRTMLVTN